MQPKKRSKKNQSSLAKFCNSGHDTTICGRYMRGQCKKCNHVNFKKVVERRKELIWSIKKSTPCTDCKRFYEHCQVQFDHLFDKTFTIGLGDIDSDKILWSEIAKCQIVCASCHALRTYLREVNNN
ncbi:MAG: hypothetical protein ACREBR_05215 [bacterium]